MTTIHWQLLGKIKNTNKQNQWFVLEKDYTMIIQYVPLRNMNTYISEKVEMDCSLHGAFLEEEKNLLCNVLPVHQRAP